MNKNIAVVGCGYWGKNLVRNYFELGVLSSICDPNHSIATTLSKKYNVKSCSFAKILDDPNIKGVVLAVPAELHASMAVDAMNKGKHVFVEKPLAMNEVEANLMIATAEKNNVQLMVGHLLQYHPIFKKVLKMVKNGDIGEINYIYSNRLSFGKVRSKEDVIWSFAPHDISMILSLVNEEPEHISCKSSSFLQKNLADIASIHMKFKSGIKSDIRVSWANPLKEVKLVVTGKSGMLVFDDTKTWSEKLVLHSYEIDHLKELNLKKTKEEHIKVTEEEPLKNECQHFISVVEGNFKPFTDVFEGLKVLKVLTTASLVNETNSL
ncbi:Gfo/Idh/MocA family oxidoreductase [Candidatus Pelagibacter sp.]|nr:Gfo/Idh/MocA family oxidoreductase [Candidatus Pelagibacter sp.]